MIRHALPAFSVFPYYTKTNARTDAEKRLQGVLYALKNGDQISGPKGSQSASEWFAEVVAGERGKVPDGFLGPRVCLVPVPSSTVTSVPPSGSCWPMLDLSEHLVQAGLAGAACAAATRHTAVERAHLLRGTDRPLPSVMDYANSLAVDLSVAVKFPNITLIDDVLSSGSNAMGVAVALNRAGFRGRIRILTATHTVGADFEGNLAEPLASQVVWLEGRNPRAFRDNRRNPITPP